jgi:hypothetical protein
MTSFGVDPLAAGGRPLGEREREVGLPRRRREVRGHFERLPPRVVRVDGAVLGGLVARARRARRLVNDLGLQEIAPGRDVIFLQAALLSMGNP